MCEKRLLGRVSFKGFVEQLGVCLHGNQGKTCLVSDPPSCRVQRDNTATSIYTGNFEWVVGGHDDSSAFTIHGITFYLDILREFSDIPGHAGVMHVVPGAITLESGRIYSKSRDLNLAGCITYEATNYQSLSSLPSSKDTSNLDLDRNLVVKEHVRELSIGFHFTRAGKCIYAIGVTELIGCLAKLSYTVYCPRPVCKRLREPLTSVFTADGEGLVNAEADATAKRFVVIRQLHGNATARCVAALQVSRFIASRTVEVTEPNPSPLPGDLHPRSVILRTDECWSCCIREALRRPTPEDKPVNFLPPLSLTTYIL